MKKTLPLTLASLIAAPALLACTPYGQPSYIVERTPYTVRLQKAASLRHFIHTVKDLLPQECTFPVGVSTLEAEKNDFRDAVHQRMTKLSDEEKIKLIGFFNAFITRFRDPENTSVTMADFPEIPEELQEFQLFLAGRDTLFRKNPDYIPEEWEKLLALPPEKRHYRTVWVLYMLGNHFKGERHKFYDDCRNAVREGFADTAGLALRSYLLEVRDGNSLLRSIRRAAEAEAANDLDLQLFEYIPAERIRKLTDAEYFVLLNAPVCREYLALVDNSNRFRHLAHGIKFRSADICAYYACNDGDLTEAAEFIAMLEKPTLLSLYLEANIARYNGNVTLAVKKLRQWLELAAKIDPAKTPELLEKVDEEFGFYEGEALIQDVYGMLGLTMVWRRDFTDAAKFFYEAGQLSDLELLAERFMSLEDLTKFLDSIKSDSHAEIPKKYNAPDNYSKPAIARALCYITARRAFREQKYDIADKYMPDEYRKLLWDYVNFLKAGNDPQAAGNDRALALYNAAKILRHKGMELSGTAGAPDYFPGRFGNRFTMCDDCSFDTVTGYWTLCDQHQEINREVPGFNAMKDFCTVPRHLRFHYRYKAAELALQAGTLAEDEDLRALINLFGGECLRLRSPMEADIFYKNLVRHSGNTLLGKFADRLRWFPQIEVLQKEIMSEKPLASLDKVKALMQEAFPGGE